MKLFKKFLLPFLSVLGLVGTALLLTSLLWSVFQTVPSPLFYISIAFSAWLFGRFSGFLASFLAVLAINLFLRHPNYVIDFSPQGLVSSGLMLSVGLTFSWLITANKKSEAEKSRLNAEIENQRKRLSDIVSSVPGVVWEAWGQPDKVTQRTDFVSDYVETMLGYRVEEWLAQPNFWLSIVHSDDREKAAERSFGHFSRGGANVNTFRWMTKDEREIWVESHSIVITDDAGNPIGMRGVTLDITERKEIEKEREQLFEREKDARRKAEDANRLKDEFLATLSHELRTPLNSILGWAQMLAKNTLDAETTKYGIQVIERNARNQNQLINDILDVSRIITGKLRLTVADADLKSVIDAAIEAVRISANLKNIRVDFKYDERVPKIKADADRLQQVFWNLLSNAIKFTPAGGSVSVAVEKSANFVRVSISDTGQGIESEYLPYVFDRFSQADSSSTRLHGGLGLGLAIVRHLVEIHGGSVRAESEGLGKGATFVVDLPAEIESKSPDFAPHDDFPPTIEGDFQIENNAPPQLKNYRVLLVEDDADSLELIKMFLEQSGASVTTSISSFEALSILATEKFDVLISDIGMPGENGYEFMQKVRSLKSEKGGLTPAIALTAYAGNKDRSDAIAAGFQTHLTKPIDKESLIAAVSALVERRKPVSV